ncbi:winged helix-turn-helix transcriptional regulator [Saccharopolyspora sp. HNM0986]|uniref:GntR family transcriptional regulator n=1 Tax=Saccharopolyspora galaxeae TaxID=2781241 RepID=UPI00190C58A7|nr:winged helix-turn-helix domain-containing protein [Saccharopolyspora sp. HNM0986]MBK0865483.1 winged helix-turn-helix transcriptional regulator [Saccharopolyspora sp. HNM0986]
MVESAPDEDKRPASRRVAEALLSQIESGDLRPGAALPTYRGLADEFGVAVNTAMAAVRLLRDRGAVTIRPNAGAQVRDRAEDVDFAAELKKVRAEVSDLRAEVRRFDTALEDLEAQIESLAEHADEATDTGRTS